MNTLDKLKNDKLYYLSIGGCGEFGMNCSLLLYNRRFIIIDAGSLFPEDWQLGVHSIIPSLEYFMNLKYHFDGYIITHGHEDHIGALSHFYKKYPGAIFASPWTCALITRKFNELSLPTDRLKKVQVSQNIKLPHFKIKYIHASHSIPDACSLFISTPKGNIFHTGDFKVDFKPIAGRPTKKEDLTAIAKKGVDLLLVDSTNAKNSGFCPSESSVTKPLRSVLSKSTGKIFITTFSSNLWRIISILKICEQIDKKVLILGLSFKRCIETAVDLGYLTVKKSLFVDEIQANRMNRSKLVIICSGSQGETKSALARIAADEHKKIKITREDTVIFSSRIIPGNEKPLFKLCDKINEKGAHIITTRDQPNIHVSGHGYFEDIKFYINCLKPQFYIPIHGSYTHLMYNYKIAEQEMNSPKDTTMIKNGYILEIDKSDIKIRGELPLNRAYIDQNSYHEMSKRDLNERLKIGELGLAIISGLYSNRKNKFLQGPTIDLHGLSFGTDEQKAHWKQETELILSGSLTKLIQEFNSDSAEICEQSRIDLRRMLFKKLKKKPQVISKIFILK